MKYNSRWNHRYLFWYSHKNREILSTMISRYRNIQLLHSYDIVYVYYPIKPILNKKQWISIIWHTLYLIWLHHLYPHLISVLQIKLHPTLFLFPPLKSILPNICYELQILVHPILILYPMTIGLMSVTRDIIRCVTSNSCIAIFSVHLFHALYSDYYSI